MSLVRSQTLVIQDEDGFSLRTFDAPQWTLTKLEAPIPPWRADYVTVPGRDGYLDLSRALTGTVVRDARTVTAEVFCECEDHDEAVGIEWTIREVIDGKRVRVKTPETLAYNSGAYYLGNARIKSSESPFNYLRIEFEFTCDPFLYVGDGYATLSHGGTTTAQGAPRAALTAANVTALNERRARVEVSYAADSNAARETAAMSSVGLWMQRSVNAFDASAHTLLDQAKSRANASGATWQQGTAVHRSGQRIFTDELGENWQQRIILTALNTSDARYQTNGFVPVFPLMGGTGSVYIDVFMSGTVTAIGAAAGGTAAGITLEYGGASGALNPTGANWATYGSTQNATFTPETKIYAGERIFHVQATDAGAGNANPLNSLVLGINWLHTGTDGLQFAFSISGTSTVTAWTAASNTSVLFPLPGTIQATGGTGGVTDAAEIDVFTTTLTKRTAQGWTPYRAEAAASESTLASATRAWFPAATGAVTYMQAHPAAADGRACRGLLTWRLTFYNVTTASMTAGSMATDLYIENSASPVYLKYGGSSTVLPRNAGNPKLTPYTIKPGTTSISYAIVGDEADGEVNRLTWTRGVL